MSRFAKGYRKDPTHKRTQKSSRELLGVSPSTPSSASLESFEYRPVLDQNGCGSCTGHGTAQGLFASFAAAGSALAFCPSPGGIYGVTRALERGGDPTQPLTDSGTMPSDTMAAIARYGIRPMTAPSPQGFNSDVDPSNVNDEPALGDLETSGQKLVTGEFRIDETSLDVVAQIRAAIASKSAVGLGFFCDMAFENWTPGDAPLNAVDLNDPQGGGHWVAITSYTTDASGKTVFRILNSWGAMWGDGGHINVTEAWLRAVASDLYVLKVS